MLLWGKKTFKRGVKEAIYANLEKLSGQVILQDSKQNLPMLYKMELLQL